MNLKKAATAGVMESGDVQITLRPNPDHGIGIQIKSSVRAIFGDAIKHTVREVLDEFDVQDALVEVYDKGALDFAIRARMQCAVCRAAEVKYDWGKDDRNG